MIKRKREEKIFFISKFENNVESTFFSDNDGSKVAEYLIRRLIKPNAITKLKTLSLMQVSKVKIYKYLYKNVLNIFESLDDSSAWT